MMLLAQKGESVIIGDNSHLNHYERGGLAALGSVYPLVLPNEKDGTLPLDKVFAKIPSADD
jgi:threonine aldolase